MAKVQTKPGGAIGAQNKTQPRFEIVRDGEPLPEIALRPVSKAPDRRRRPSRMIAAESAHCPLCDGVITRFDMEIYERHERCGPCHEALGAVGLFGQGEA